ncbi:MAG: LPS export ABC transporter permease LptF [Kiloniellales bacterium]|nr:LPS export ABC transporter permease LptF [Kiloniellales bacterium]
MNTLDRYILRETLRPFMVTMVLALLVLLIERMLQVLDLVLGSQGPLRLLFEMLAYLVPHYIGLALPFGLFLGILLGFHRMSRDSELDSVQAAGIGVHRMLRPVILSALVVAALSAVTFSYLQPYGRYAYRAMLHSISNAFVSAILNEGVFAQIGDNTFLSEKSDAEGQRFVRVFVYRNEGEGDWSVMTSREGKLEHGSLTRPPAMWLYDGVQLGGSSQDAALGARQDPSRGILHFEAMRSELDSSSNAGFRARGEDEREMTLFELWQLRDSPPEGIDSSDLIAEFHGRIVRVLTIFLLPLLAVPLAHGYRRRTRSFGIGLGVVILIVYKEVVDFGENLVESRDLTAFTGIWAPFLFFAFATSLAFVRSLMRLPRESLIGLPEWVLRLLAGLRRRFDRGSRGTA